MLYIRTYSTSSIRAMRAGRLRSKLANSVSRGQDGMSGNSSIRTKCLQYTFHSICSYNKYCSLARTK